jgi:geranylgeranyl diphosphate synthase type I
MIQNKTGALYEASAGIGAILGGGTKKEIELLSSYGRLTGSGFQIYDDVLGLVSPTEKLGKSRGIDLLRKKKTLIMIHALEHGFRMEKDVDLDSVIKKLDTLGSIEYAEKKALKMIGDGKRALSRIKNSRAKNLLLRLADYMVRRKF